MKNLYSLLLSILFTSAAFGQGTINSFSVFPANPTTTDTVFVYVDSWFSSGGCPLDYKNHGVSGNVVYATAHHCLGMLTVICGATDTFKIDPLPAGTYTFDMTLTTGALPAPCTPGIVADDNGSTTFTVSQAVGITELDLSSLTIENPVSGKLNFGKPLVESLDLYDITGKHVKTMVIGQTEVDLEQLNTGIYFLRSSTSVRKLVIN